MKRIVFFTTSCDYVGGAIMCLMETLRYIDRNEIEPYFIISKRGTTERILQERNIPYKYIRSSDWLQPEWILKTTRYKIKRPLQILSNYLAEIRTYFFLKKGCFDGYHLNSIYSGVGVKAAHALKIPVFWHLREFVDENPWTSTFINERYSYSLIEKSYQVIAVSNCVKEFYQQRMPKANIKVIYDGVEFSALNAPRKEIKFRTPLRLSMIGGVAEVKGHEDAIRAAALLKKSNVPFILTIYGRCRDLNYMQYLNDLISKLDVKDVVWFAGNKSDMHPVWSETDICLVCSKSESFGRVAVESMYQNIPVIGADNSGTKELLESEMIGMLYETGDPKVLCDRIIEMIGKKYEAQDLEIHHKNILKYDSRECAKGLVDVLSK